jgi:hypothetical protein
MNESKKNVLRCNCGNVAHKRIKTSHNGRFKGRLAICEDCYYELIKD